MKLSVALIAAAYADYPALDNFEDLQTTAESIFTNQSYFKGPMGSRWIVRFARNKSRMRRNFYRSGAKCGDNSEQDFVESRYDRSDPCHTVRNLISSFKTWTERFLYNCSGQRRHSYQAKRFDRWGDLLRDSLKKTGHYCPDEIG